jgi:predicted DNA-binding transcriptional regulator YafY
MWDTSARLLRLLSLLQARREWSGPELAERLSVSVRTVRRDVDRLRELGYPVDASLGVQGGYQLGVGGSLPPLLLDDDEAVAIAVGLRTAAIGTVEGIDETSVRALAKLEQVLPSRLRRRVNALQTFTIPVPRDGEPLVVSASTLTLLAAACRDHERVRFDYLAHGGSSSRRDVEPHRLVSWGHRWYLLAFDVSRADWRTFRVDRIVPKTPTGPRFTPRELPEGDAAAHVSRGVSAASWRYHARVRVHAPLAAVRARITPAVGTLEPYDGESCVLSTGADLLETMAVHLGMLDVDFTVLSGPPELFAQLSKLAERYGRAAASAPPR